MIVAGAIGCLFYVRKIRQLLLGSPAKFVRRFARSKEKTSEKD